MDAATLIIIASLNLLSLKVTQGYEPPKADGIYLTMDCGHTKSIPVKLFRGKYVCITERPIVGISGVTSITDLYHIPDNYSGFTIVLDKDVVSTLKSTASYMTNNVYAFVLNKEVIFTFSADQKKFNNLIEVKGNYKSRELILFYEQLLSVMKDKAGH